VTQFNGKQGGFTLVELLIVIIIIGILTSIAIPMYLHRREVAKDASVREGFHTIRVGIETYASDHGDRYPVVEEVSSTGEVGELIDGWPINPWTTGAPMNSTGGRGNFAYARTATGFTMTGFGSSGDAIIAVP